MAKHPTSSKRNKRQKLKGRYAKIREEAQLAGIIHTTPEGAVRDERVKSSSQSEQQIPGIDRAAVSRGWAVPDDKKQVVVERLLEPFLKKDIVLDKDGKQVELPPDRSLLKENAKVLVIADQRQYERDNPVKAGQARGAVNVGVQVNVDPFELYKKALEEVRSGEQPSAEDELEAALSELNSFSEKARPTEVSDDTGDEEVATEGEEPELEGRRGVQVGESDGAAKDALASREVVQEPTGDRPERDRGRRNGSGGRQQAG